MGRSCLHLAVLADSARCLPALLRHAHPDLQWAEDCVHRLAPLLHLAVEGDHVACVRVLLDVAPRAFEMLTPVDYLKTTVASSFCTFAECPAPSQIFLTRCYSILRCPTRDFLKRYSSIPNAFIDDMFDLYGESTSQTDAVIDLDRVSKWLGVPKYMLMRTQERNQAGPSRGKAARAGYIYVLRASERADGIVKIGKARDLQRRMGQHNASRADDVEVLFTFRTDDIDAVESCVKAWMKDKRYRRHKEIYRADLDMVKGIVAGCDGVGRVKTQYAKSGPSVMTGGYYIQLSPDAGAAALS